METATSQRIVDLNQVCQNHIVVEDFGRVGDDSIFQREYLQASNVINQIIKFNNHKRHSDPRGKAEYQTAVPFIGDRGTGKTSAMCSVLHKLETASDEFLALSRGNARARFICFDMIDINSMKSNENLMEIVLSRMLTCLKKLEADLSHRGGQTLDIWHGRQRTIYTKIDELSRAFSRMHWRKNFDPEEQGLAGLQKISAAQDAIESFRTLVYEFTEAIRSTKNWDCPCYMVLALDDIDMFRGSNKLDNNSQFALLEQIYDYLRVPNVVVLLTFNEQILKRNCMNHYYDAYFRHDSGQQRTTDEQEEIATLTKQFLSKLFPQEQRIYMPNFLFVNADNCPNLYVVPLISEETKPFPPFHHLSDYNFNSIGIPEPRAIPVKELMLRLIAHKTGVYFDINGTKKHFLEPRNLRELGTMLQVISLWPDPDGAEDPETIRVKNRETFLNYLRNQFAGEHLQPEAYRAFQGISTLPLARQSRALVDDVRRYRMTSVETPDEFGYIRSTNRDRWKYSYGELAHNIYYSTRVHNSGTTLYSKEYIHCVLGSQSIILNQMLYAEDRGHFLEFIGSSIGGRWANDMLPKFYRAEQRNSANPAGSYSTTVRRFLKLRVPEDVQASILECPGSEEEERTGCETAIQQFAEALALIGMFFTGYPPAGLKIKLEAHMETFCGKASPVFYLESTSEDHVCFNALNPFLNLYAVTDPRDRTKQRHYLEYISGKLRSLTGDFPLTESLNQKIQEGIEAAEMLGPEPLAPKGSDVGKLVQADPRRMKVDVGNEARKLLDIMGEHGTSLNRFKEAWEGIMDQLGCALEEQAPADSVRESAVFAHQNLDVGMTVPVQHLDMMYNILKRVASVSYHDIPEEADVKEAYDYFIRLYESIGQELEAQDTRYGATSADLAVKYRKSFFYRIFTAKDTSSPDYNPYLKDAFDTIIQNILIDMEARKKTRIGD